MPKRIKEIVEKVQFYYGKKETGYTSPSDIVRELNVESGNVFTDFIQEYAETRMVSEFLQPFIAPSAEIPLNLSGTGAKPSALAHAISFRLEDDTAGEILEIAFWRNRLKHPNKPPTADFPILRMVGNSIEVRPINSGKIFLDYFKFPTEAVYDTIVSGDELIYQDGTSVDWEWHKTIEDRIINRVLTNIGIPIKDRDLIGYSQNEKIQE
jgi:hypothetical protein